MPSNDLVRYPEIAKRINDTIAKSPHIPTGHGQLAYIVRELKKRFDVEVSRERVRTWVNGIREPRPESRIQLAEVLGVDAGWLWSGVTAPAQKTGAAAEMTIGLLLQSGGWKVRQSQSRDYDLDAEIGGRGYKIECKQARHDDGKWRVKLPANINDVVFLALYVNPQKAEIGVLHVEGEPGAEVVMQPSGGEMVVQGGSAKAINDFTKPI